MIVLQVKDFKFRKKYYKFEKLRQIKKYTITNLFQLNLIKKKIFMRNWYYSFLSYIFAGFLQIRKNWISYYAYFYIIVLFLLFSLSLGNTSFCDPAELTAIRESEPCILQPHAVELTPDSPPEAPGSPPEKEPSSCSLTEEEKKKEQGYSILTKIAIGYVVCYVVTGTVLYVALTVLIYRYGR